MGTVGTCEQVGGAVSSKLGEVLSEMNEKASEGLAPYQPLINDIQSGVTDQVKVVG